VYGVLLILTSGEVVMPFGAPERTLDSDVFWERVNMSEDLVATGPDVATIGYKNLLSKLVILNCPAACFTIDGVGGTNLPPPATAILLG